MQEDLRTRRDDCLSKLSAIAHISKSPGNHRLQPHTIVKARLSRWIKAIACDLRAQAGEPKGQPAANKAGVTGEKYRTPAPEIGVGRAAVLPAIADHPRRRLGLAQLVEQQEIAIGVHALPESAVMVGAELILAR